MLLKGQFLLGSVLAAIVPAMAEMPLLPAEAQEHFVLGDRSSPPKYQFVNLGPVSVDSQDRIYVADKVAQRIRVYDPEGAYLRTIGEPGEGEERFRDIKAIFHNPQDELFVVDLIEHSLTRFSPSGEAVETIRLQAPNARTLWRIQSFGKKGYLVAANDFSKEPTGFLFHVYDASLYRARSHFGGFDDLFPSHGIAEEILSNANPGYFLIVGTSVTCVPRLYRGRMFRYRLSKEGWRLERVLA